MKTDQTTNSAPVTRDVTRDTPTKVRDRNGIVWEHDEGDGYVSPETNTMPAVFLPLDVIDRIHGPLTAVTSEGARHDKR